MVSVCPVTSRDNPRIRGAFVGDVEFRQIDVKLLFHLYGQITSETKGGSDYYPLVNVYITIENHHFNGKTHYKWPFSIAMLVYQRVVTTARMAA